MTTLQDRLAVALDGRYTILQQLGEGGMAIVYLARDLRHDRSVALKALRPEISAEIGEDRFLREIRLAAGLNHPHILPVHDSGNAGGVLFYVMPNMEGAALRDRLERERQLPLEEALRLTREVASALDYAHRHNVVHRDIKPENILLHEGAAMVADFGIGKAVTGGRTITRTGMSIGTPAYMSPEQASGETDINGRSDLYSLGCVLYEMLAGEALFTGPTAQAILVKRFMSPIPKVQSARDVPSEVDDLLGKLLTRSPVDRIASGQQLIEALDRIRRARQTSVGKSEADRKLRPQKSIAVLPLTNLSADPENEYFSDGMTEEIINALAKVPSLQVGSRSSSFAFKGKNVDVREVGEKLGVSTVLEGSVRKIGSRIRIAAQLVNVENGYQLWSETYDRQLEDVFAIQDEISRAIVDALKLRLVDSSEQLVVPAKNLEAYNLYLKGRFFYHKFTEVGLRKSLDFYQHVLLQDPGFARAYAGIADCWCQLADDWMAPEEAYPRAKAASKRALEYDPELAEAMTALGKVLCWYEWDFKAGEEQLRKAVSLNPNDAEAAWSFGSALPTVGKLGEAISEMRRAVMLDPIFPKSSRWLSRFLLYAGDYTGAIAQAEKTLELDSDYFQSYLDAGSAALAQGDAEKALEWYQRGQRLETSVRSYDALIVRALAALNRREEAEEILGRLDEDARRHYMREEILAMGYAAMGNLDRAFSCLDRAIQARSAGVIYLKLDPGYEPLRGDPRFNASLQRIGLS